MLKILIVDDDEVDRMAVRRVLKTAGVTSTVQEVEGCATAIAALSDQKFDIALVDFGLPDGDGFALLNQSRALGISVPMIILTGQGDEETAVGLMKAGASDYLAKSKISPDTLSHCLHRAIRLHRLEIQAQLATQRQQESEERYRLVLEGSNDGIWDWDITTNEIYWNDRFLEIVGLPQSERMGTLDTFYQLLHPDDRQPVRAALQTHLATGKKYSVELRLRHTNGEYRYCTCRGKAQRNAQGLPVRMAGIISDITERKQTEKVLIQQHQRSQLYAELTLKIRQSLQITEILQTTVQEVRQLLQADRVLIYQLFADGTGTVVTEAVLPGFPVIFGQNIVDPCFRESYIEKYQQGRISAIADIENSQVQPCHIKLLQQFAVKANLVVPIIHTEQTLENSPPSTVQNQNRLWGLLIAHQCATVRQWQASEIELLQQLANQVSIAIAHANVMEQVSEMLAQQTEISQQLSAKNLALESALTDLQKTQAQLIQSEKMSGLGQLVAGVAHEINNPITFIYSNITPAQQYIEDLLHLIQLYQQQYPQANPEIEAAIESLELEFLMEDLLKLFSSMKVGAERIRTIVQSLRNFSRSDEAQMKPVDIHEGLDSTLLLLQHRLNDTGEHPVQIIKEYGDLPQIECYPQQLNQVFMNIVTNGIDALQNCENPTLKICTEVRNHQAIIRIIDNGLGMPPEVNQRVFDPFFTTKPVGSGTGLGLSVSYQIIVEKHGGELHCISAPGQGSEFIIHLPLHPEKEQRSLSEKNWNQSLRDHARISKKSRAEPVGESLRR